MQSQVVYQEQHSVRATERNISRQDKRKNVIQFQITRFSDVLMLVPPPNTPTPYIYPSVVNDPTHTIPPLGIKDSD